MANAYRYLGREEYFRANAYEEASNILENLDVDIAGYAEDIKKLEAIRGIGESIAEKITEYLKTGRIRTFEKIKKKVPYGLLELMDISGFGPAILKRLYEEMGIRNKEGLIRALKTGRLNSRMGLGEKQTRKMEHALSQFSEIKRIPLKEAAQIGEELLDYIKKIPGVQQAELAGSLRRKKETIGDIDLVIMATPENRKKIADRIVSWSKVKEILAKGNTKISLLLDPKHIQVDIRLVDQDEFGASLVYFTGSREHTIRLRTLAKKEGYKINEYGIFNRQNGKKIAGSTEEGIYQALGLTYIPPERRTGNEEFEITDAVKSKPGKKKN